MTLNMNCRSNVTITMFWIEDTDTMTACWNKPLTDSGKGYLKANRFFPGQCQQATWMTVLSPLALWIARRGLRTRQTRKIFRTDTAPALKFKKSINWLMVMMIKGRLFLQIVLINWCFDLNLNFVWKPVAEYDGNKGDPDHEHIQQICWGGEVEPLLQVLVQSHQKKREQFLIDWDFYFLPLVYTWGSHVATLLKRPVRKHLERDLESENCCEEIVKVAEDPAKVSN